MIFNKLVVLNNIIKLLNNILIRRKSYGIAISLPKKLINDFDEVLNDGRYNSRSEGVQKALKEYILRHKMDK